MTVYRFTRPPLEMVSSSPDLLHGRDSYHLEITDVVDRTGPKGKYLLVKYKVIDGTFAGFKPSPDFISMSSASERRRASFLCAIFSNPPGEFTIEELRANLLGKRLVAHVTESVYEGIKINKFSHYRRITDCTKWGRNEFKKTRKELKTTESVLRGIVGNGKRRMKIRPSKNKRKTKKKS